MALSEGTTPWHFHVVSLRSSPWPPPSLVTWPENLAIKSQNVEITLSWYHRHPERTCTSQGGRLKWLPKYVNDLCHLHYALLNVLYNLIFVFVSCVSQQIQSEKKERNTAGQFAISVYMLLTYSPVPDLDSFGPALHLGQPNPTYCNCSYYQLNPTYCCCSYYHYRHYLAKGLC